MAKLGYLAIASLDGYIADEQGDFTWARPSDEVHAFINDLARGVGTYLYGRRMYETMVAWETMHQLPGLSAITLDFARVWQSAEKVVYSRTLQSPSSARTRIERELDLAALRQLKHDAPSDAFIGGPELAAPAIRAGLVDEYHLFFAPAIVGGGKRFLPADTRLDLGLIDERRFDGDFVYACYAGRSP
jgi:dihydrofolate reductase